MPFLSHLFLLFSPCHTFNYCLSLRSTLRASFTCSKIMCLLGLRLSNSMTFLLDKMNSSHVPMGHMCNIKTSRSSSIHKATTWPCSHRSSFICYSSLHIVHQSVLYQIPVKFPRNKHLNIINTVSSTLASFMICCMLHPLISLLYEEHGITVRNSSVHFARWTWWV